MSFRKRPAGRSGLAAEPAFDWLAGCRMGLDADIVVGPAFSRVTAELAWRERHSAAGRGASALA